MVSVSISFFNMTSNPFFIQNCTQNVMCPLEDRKAVPGQVLSAVTAEILAVALGSGLGCFKPTGPCSELARFNILVNK